MTTETAETGPVDYLVVEFPGNRMKGEALARLVDLVDAGTIRVLDLVFVRRERGRLDAGRRDRRPGRRR